VFHTTVYKPAFLLPSSVAFNCRHCEAFDCPNSKLLKRANPWIGKEKAEAISYSSGAEPEGEFFGS
jgi:hypothetical protein